MKHRAISFITVLALCLSLCPTWALAAGGESDTNQCPHHLVHTAECGYTLPVPGQDCAHEHDENCFTTCVYQRTEDCNLELEPSLGIYECSEDTGCVISTLACLHVHDEFCGYVPESAGAPCTFVCRVCPVEDLIDKLPRSVTPDNKNYVEDQLNTILALYTELDAGEQDQLDLSRCFDLQFQMDASNAPMLISDGVYDFSDVLTGNTERIDPYKVNDLSLSYDIQGYSFRATKTSAFLVQNSGLLSLKGSGEIESKKGSGVEVEKDCQLYIKDPCLTVIGSDYGLDIASGATVKLSGGTYTGGIAAIRTADGNFAALLEAGHAYFDTSGNQIQSEDMAKSKTVTIQALPEIKWAANDPVAVYYNGSAVEKTDLPNVNVIIKASGVSGDLSQYLQYSYRKPGESTYIDGLPVNAGTYDIIASLPAMPAQNCHAASSEPIKLTIKKIENVVTTAPIAAAPTYNGSSQALVTAGTVDAGAVGAVIEFAQSEGGPYSTNIPTGVNAGNYNVWYRVVGTENYDGVSETKIDNVNIQRKQITPAVTLEYDTCLYDGGEKEPKVTVKDGETVLPDAEYIVAYNNNRDVSTTEKPATVTVTDKTDKENGNYTINQVSVNFKITHLTQDALSITNQPDTVTYGDTFTLGTSGGSGNGGITWKIIPDGTNVATVDPNSGQFTITHPGTATVQATKSGIHNDNENYENAIATWTFTAVKKPVTPVVTVKDREYQESVMTADLIVTWKDGALVNGDTITLNLTGSFDDDKAGTDKTVTISGTVPDSDKYEIKLPETTTGNITKQTVVAEQLTGETLTYSASEQDLLASSKKGSLEFSLAKDGPYSITIPKGKNAGSYTVWYKQPGDDNHKESELKTFITTINPKVLGDSSIKLSSETFTYDGTEKRPTVTVKDGEMVIPSSEYTASYSNNIALSTDENPATVTVTDNAGGNYIVNGTKTFTITADSAVLTGTPEEKDLTYTGKAQELVRVGTAANGKVVYCDTKDGTYGDKIPEGTDAATYTVWYKVIANTGYSNTDNPRSVQVTIRPKEVISPVIELSNDKFTYDGNAKEPSVTVQDGGVTIDVTNGVPEFTVSYLDNVNAGTATAIVRNANGGNYIVNGTATFEIEKADIAAVIAPKPETNLTYTGSPQNLVTVESLPNGGTLEYSLDGNMYSASIPTGTAADDYYVWYRVKGDGNHNDIAGTELENPVTIAKQTVTDPAIEFKPSSAVYDNTVKKPDVTVRDNNGRVIPESEYTVTYDSTTDWKTAGSHTVTITNKANGNYIISQKNATFTIFPAGQNPLTIITDKNTDVYYGDTFRLSATGGSGTGAIHWNIAENNAAASISTDGVVTVTDVGQFTVEAQRLADGGYDVSNTDSVTFNAKPKPAPAAVNAANKTYDGNKEAILTAAINSVYLVSGDVVVLNAKGSFADADVGTNKPVKVESLTIEGDLARKYEITYPDTIRASITQAMSELENPPVIQDGWTYRGESKELLTFKGNTKDNIGVITYSLSKEGEYSTEIPTGKDAGTYTVWYRVEETGNYTGIAPAATSSVTVAKANLTISQESYPTASPIASGRPLRESTLTRAGSASFGETTVTGTFDWTNGDSVFGGDGLYKVTFTPDDIYITNFNTVEIQVHVSEQTTYVTSGGGETSGTSSSTPANTTPMVSEGDAISVPIQASMQDGTAKAVMNAADGNKLVKEAVANQSTNVIIKPEITDYVTKTEVSLPASTVRQLNRETNADLTVSSPIADVTIPNTALDTLSSSGGTVSVVTEQLNNMVVLTLTADGKEVETIPGGLTLIVPVENAGPGDVAVLVHDDGTRETIRKSVLVYDDGDSDVNVLARKVVTKSGKMSIPLNGSAAVEIVDNSKDFTDVSEENWAFDAVAFASSHEMFNGTSETTFSPDQPMSRAMLATVLYNLEGHPAQGKASEFNDVSSDAWYAAGVSWAAANGITNGYGDGQFGPNDNITREQFAVMLWKYAGSPAANGRAFSFTDANQANSYAIEALRWATANGILNGYGDGRLDPSGLATRAQAAQMLKNFMENTLR